MATPNQSIPRNGAQQTELTLEELRVQLNAFSLTAEQMNELEKDRISRRLGVSVEQLKKERYFD